MNCHDKLAFFSRITADHHVLAPPFSFGVKEQLEDSSCLRHRWEVARDVSSHPASTSIYAHIPFCLKKRCAYCMYGSTTHFSEQELRHYLLSIEQEFAEWKFFFPALIRNLYIGGGTPSVYPPKQFREFLEIFHRLNCSSRGERTCEVSPFTALIEHVDVMAECGFNRLSIGVQSFDAGVLAAVNRPYSSFEKIQSLCQRARNLGFLDVNLDLMMGLPGIQEANLRRSVQLAIAAGALSISAYYWRQTPIPRTELINQFQIVVSEIRHCGWTLENGTEQSEYHLFFAPERCRDTLRYSTTANCIDNQQVIGLGQYAHGYRSALSYSHDSVDRYFAWQMGEESQIRMGVANMLFHHANHINLTFFKHLYGIAFTELFESEVSQLRQLHAIQENDAELCLCSDNEIERLALQKFFWDQDYLMRTYGQTSE